MDELPPDRWGRILFGLKLSVPYSTVPTFYTSRRKRSWLLAFLFVGRSFRPTEGVGPHKEIQNSER